MATQYLNQEEREVLQKFVDKSPEGTAFLNRAQIILLADDGLATESIAAQLALPVMRVRQMLRAFLREGMALFPHELMLPPPNFSVEDPIAEASRKIMADLLENLKNLEPELTNQIDVTSVHETRKTIRSLRTALRLFEPYFEEGLLNEYSRRFRKTMRRLNGPRDLAVALLRLEEFVAALEEEADLDEEQVSSFAALKEYWLTLKNAADEKASRYLKKGKYQELLVDFEQFVQSEGLGVLESDDLLAPYKTGHLAPVLIHEKLAAVRAFDDYIASASLRRLHLLRIRCKELRYTMEFFQPVMGASASDPIEAVKRLLIHLGDLNDVRVHLAMLAEVDDEEAVPAAATYGINREDVRFQLLNDLPLVWADVDQVGWRQKLGVALAPL